MPMRVARLILLICPFLFAGTALAAERVALVVGNAGYAHVAPLRNALNDAADMAAALRELGFDVTEGRDLDRRGMSATAREFARKAEGAGLALFYYSGHGLQLGGANYLVPVDAKIASEADVPVEAIDLASVVGSVEAEKRAGIVFIDANRDNPFARRSRGLSATPEIAGTGLLIAFATGPGDVALDGDGRNGQFTAALLKHIKTPGLEIWPMLSRVRADVVAATGGRQVPWVNSSLLGEVYLAGR